MPNFRLALRTLFKTPFVTAVAILSLALGIGANSAIFSLFDQMLLRPLPVPSPGELVNFSSLGPKPGSNSCGPAGSCDEIFSYTVAQRTREFGLRMALGADGGRVRGMVMKQVAVMALVGGGVGLVIAIGVGRLAESLLFEMKGYDPLVIGVSTVALAVVALGAGFIPALRASKIDPMNALRYE